MEIVTATQLRNDVGDALRRVSDGAVLLVTTHGRPVALMAPPNICISNKTAVLYDGTDGEIHVTLKISEDNNE